MDVLISPEVFFCSREVPYEREFIVIKRDVFPCF